jgi:hypothetical protein
MILDELLIDDLNEAKMAEHGVGALEVQEVLISERREVFRNPAHSRRDGAPYVLVGPTRAGRILTIPIDSTPVEGLWRPRTAFSSGKQQLAAYARRHQER